MQDFGDIDNLYNHVLGLKELMLQAKDIVFELKLLNQGRHRISLYC